MLFTIYVHNTYVAVSLNSFEEDKDEKSFLRKEVENVFNQCYGEQTCNWCVRASRQMLLYSYTLTCACSNFFDYSHAPSARFPYSKV